MTFNPQNEESLTHTSQCALLNMFEHLPDALYCIDDAETIVYVNARAQTITRVPQEQLLGQPFWHSVPQLMSATLYQAVRKTRQTQEPTEVEYWSSVLTAWLHVQLTPTIGGIILQFHEIKAAPQHLKTVTPNLHLNANTCKGLHVRIAYLTSEGIVLENNDEHFDGTHIRREEVLGKSIAETSWWSSSPTTQEQIHAAITQASGGDTVHLETIIHPTEEVDLHLEATIAPNLDVNQHITSLVIVEIAYPAYNRDETDISALIDAIPQLAWTGKPDGTVDYCNKRWRAYTGLNCQEAQGDGWKQCTHPDDLQHVLSVWLHAIQTGMPYEVEQRLRNGATGEYRWFLMQATPYTDEQGTILKYVGTCTDIDDKKRREDKLRDLVNAIPQLVWIAGPDGSILYNNQRLIDYQAKTLQQVRGEGWMTCVHPDDQQRVQQVWQASIQTGQPYEVEHRMQDGTTGEYRWFLVRGVPQRNAEGAIIYWFGTCTDINKQKQAEQQLKESQENLRVLAETLPHLVWGTGPDGLSDYFNQRFYDYIGATWEQLHGYGWSQFVHPEDRERTLAARAQALCTGLPYDVAYRFRSGHAGIYRWFLARAMPVRDDTGRIVRWFGTCTDIEEQKRTEEALRESQEQASILMNSSIIGINIADGERIMDANDTYLRLTGYTREDLHAGKISWMDMTPPEYLERTQKAHQELATQRTMTPYEKEYICKDGSRLPVLVGRVALQHHPSQTIGFLLDNSARKELEQRRDAFISMASHELKTPLTALKMQAQLVRKRLERQSHHEAATLISRIDGPIKQLERLVGELLDVSKIQAGRLEYLHEEVDLNALLHEVTDTMQQIQTTHTIQVRGETPCLLIGDRDRLGQVFINLISNAIKYSPGAEKVEVDLITSSETATIRVHDYGLGIPQEQRDKIFERFYRVSGPNQKAIPGLGMGLYIVAEIVRHHGGTLAVESAVGKGSTFQVTLPRKRES
ncbi:PAS domain S-box protein [Ktedonospora formicarum]|uniref:histidine kinase n=1 Tax=Ktedonospora formicarum TaxID=2778364 RepID=A0A8J3MR38_9CHLR|nr:PAS domain S-box protein [Ktedonospora formicarum]GHO41915.1 hypothetical protein KSX_00780 [Ktedonospora formicarum]